MSSAVVSHIGDSTRNAQVDQVIGFRCAAGKDFPSVGL